MIINIEPQDRTRGKVERRQNTVEEHDSSRRLKPDRFTSLGVSVLIWNVLATERAETSNSSEVLLVTDSVTEIASLTIQSLYNSLCA